MKDEDSEISFIIITYVSIKTPFFLNFIVKLGSLFTYCMFLVKSPHILKHMKSSSLQFLAKGNVKIETNDDYK